MSIAIYHETETDLFGTINQGLSPEASTASILTGFFEKITGASNVERTPNDLTKLFVINPKNLGGQSSEIIKATSHTTASGITTLSTVIRGLALDGGYDEAGSVSAAKEWPTGTEIGCVLTHYHLNPIINVLNGTLGSAYNNLRIGDETAADITLYAQNDQTNKPFLRYDESESAWAYSDDGVSTTLIRSGAAGGLTAGDNIHLDVSAISFPSADGKCIYEQTATTGSAMSITRNLASASTDAPVVLLTQTNTGDDQSLLKLNNDSTGSFALEIDSEATTVASVSITSSGIGTGTENGLVVIQDHASNVNGVIYGRQDGTGMGMESDIVGVLGASKYGLYVHSNAVQVTSPLAYFSQDNASSDQACIFVKNDGTGGGIKIEQNNNGYGLWIDATITDISGNSLLRIENDGALVGGDALASFIASNSSTERPVVAIVNNGIGSGVFLDNNNTDSIAIDIDSESETKQSLRITGNQTTSDTLLIQANGIGTGSTNALAVIQDNASNVNGVIYGRQDGTGIGIESDIVGVLGASKYGLYVHSNAVQVTSPLAYFLQDNVSSDQPCLSMKNDGTGGIFNLQQASADINIFAGTSVASGGADGDVHVRQSTTDSEISVNENGTWKGCKRISVAIGSSARAQSEGAGQVTITHNLGVVPSLIKITANDSGDHTLSVGVWQGAYDEAGDYKYYKVNTQASEITNSTTYLVDVGTGGNFWKADLYSAPTATQFVLDFTIASTPGLVSYTWEAYP